MADAQTTDTEEELIPVETPIEPQEPDDDGDDGDEEQDDERLAESEDDHEEDVAAGASNRERRKKRREAVKRAKEAAERKIALLEQQNALFQQRLAAIEGHTTSTAVQGLEQRIAQAREDVRKAEMIIAKATEAGNGEDVVAAMRIREQAAAEFQQLSGTYQQIEQARQQPQQPQVDPQVIGYAQQWLQANSWYNPAGTDRDSALTKAIDAEVAAEGYDPKTRDYWEELTRRVADAIGEDGDAPKQKTRKAPPMGRTREHAPVSSKREIFVTPERKAAMQEAGVWDDPTLRQRYLKAYQTYDNGSAR